MNCKKCGTQNSEGMKYCKYCGNELTNEYYIEDDKEDEKKVSKFTMAIIVLIVLTSLAIVGVITRLIVSVTGNGTNDYQTESIAKTSFVEEETSQETTVSEVKVPDVVGMLSSDAYEMFDDEGIVYDVSYVYSNTVTEDYVISQSPSGGKMISDTEEVLIYVSMGAKTNSSSYNTSSTTTTSEYILEGSDSRYIDESEVDSMDEDTLVLALNEIYARHGRKFDTKKISKYFNSKSWYKGTVDANDFDTSVFNKYENSNIALILDVLKEKGYRD